MFQRPQSTRKLQKQSTRQPTLWSWSLYHQLLDYWRNFPLTTSRKVLVVECVRKQQPLSTTGCRRRLWFCGLLSLALEPTDYTDHHRRWVGWVWCGMNKVVVGFVFRCPAVIPVQFSLMALPTVWSLKGPDSVNMEVVPCCDLFYSKERYWCHWNKNGHIQTNSHWTNFLQLKFVTK